MGRKWENEMGYEGLRRAKVKGKKLQELRCMLILMEMKKKHLGEKVRLRSSPNSSILTSGSVVRAHFRMLICNPTNRQFWIRIQM